MSEVSELKDVLLWFIKEQTQFNQEQRQFNEEQRQFTQEQRQFNEHIEKKVDRVQYFLEETVATQAKMFFEEQVEMKADMREMESEITSLKNKLSDLSWRVNLLFKA